MKTNKSDKDQVNETLNGTSENIDATNEQLNKENSAEDNINIDQETDNVAIEKELLEKKCNDLNDAHLRLMAEYDNYRKRTLREKAELIKNGGESSLKALLPVIDDFDRAIENISTAKDMQAVAEGVDLIYAKFIAYLTSQGVKEIEVKGKPFDADISEAIAIVPAPSEDVKGQVLECLEKGYTLNDKIIRHSKVVVAE